VEETNKMLKEGEETLEFINQSYQQTETNIADQNQKMEDLQTRLERSEALIDELAKEKNRWADLEEQLDTKLVKLQGDCLISSTFLS